ncbi:MAG: hypothetical protein WCS51_01070 [Bacilli bacterium]
MDRNANRYKDNVLSSNGKKFLGYTFDYMITLVFLITFYVLVNLIGSSIPYVKNTRSTLATSQGELYSFVENTYLGELDESGSLKDSSDMADQYVKSSVLYTLKLSGLSDVEISYTSYKDVKPITPETDKLFMYYTEYKPNKLGEYSSAPSENKDAYGKEYYLNNILKTTENNYFEDSDYPYIKIDIAKSIDNYFREENYSVGKTAYTTIYNAYYDGYSNAIDEVTTYNSSYVLLNETFESYRLNLFNVQVLEILISYILGFLCSFLLPILIFKDGRTFGFRVLKQVFTDVDNLRVNWKNNLVKGLIEFVMQFWVIDLFCLVLFSSSGVYIMMHPLFGTISIFYISIFSLILTICSFILVFINKDKKQTISEFLSREVLKDTMEFEVKDENGK